LCVCVLAAERLDPEDALQRLVEAGEHDMAFTLAHTCGTGLDVVVRMLVRQCLDTGTQPRYAVARAPGPASAPVQRKVGGHASVRGVTLWGRFMQGRAALDAAADVAGQV
jgi:hypothetical protein